MTIGAILLRVSTQRQAESDKASYDVQRDACLAYATARGIDVPSDLYRSGKKSPSATNTGCATDSRQRLPPPSKAAIKRSSCGDWIG